MSEGSLMLCSPSVVSQKTVLYFDGQRCALRHHKPLLLTESERRTLDIQEVKTKGAGLYT
jgi:hypothetical protein